MVISPVLMYKRRMPDALPVLTFHAVDVRRSVLSCPPEVFQPAGGNALYVFALAE